MEAGDPRLRTVSHLADGLANRRARAHYLEVFALPQHALRHFGEISLAKQAALHLVGRFRPPDSLDRRIGLAIRRSNAERTNER